MYELVRTHTMLLLGKQMKNHGPDSYKLDAATDGSIVSCANPSPLKEHNRKYLSGLFGRGILNSKSIFIHQDEAAFQHFDLIYKLIDFDALSLPDSQLGEMLEKAQQFGFCGLNITSPFKQLILQYVDEISKEADLFGAANTIAFENGKKIAYNTDWYGFYESFRIKVSDCAPNIVLQLGAGGAGSALVYALLRLGTKELYLSDPDQAKIDSLISKLKPHFPNQKIIPIQNPIEISGQVDGVVQASPVGMARFPGIPMETVNLHSGQWVVDIIYFPSETEFLRQAREKGCRTFNGDGMVVHQAAMAFELFTGTKPDTERMLKRFLTFK